MQLRRLAVQIRSEDGREGGTGEVTVARPPLIRRLWKAGLIFLLGAVIGALLLPVPLIHLFGIMFFLAMSGLAVRRVLSRTVLKAAHGRCPSCQREGDYFVGMGGKKLVFPISTSCPHCKVGLTLHSAG